MSEVQVLLVDGIPESGNMDVDVTLKKEHDGMPGSSNCGTNMAMASSPLEKRFDDSSHNIVVKSWTWDSFTTWHIQQNNIFFNRLVEEGYQHIRSMDSMCFFTFPKLNTSTACSECLEW